MVLSKLSHPFVYIDDEDPGYIYRAIRPHNLQMSKSNELKLLDKIGHPSVLIDYEVTDKTLEVGGNICVLIRAKRIPADIRIQDLTKKQTKKLLCDQIDLCVSCLEKDVCLVDISESNILYWAGNSYFVDLNAFCDPDCPLRGTPFAYARMSYMVNRYLGGKNNITSTIHADHVSIKSYNDWCAKNWTSNQDLDLWYRFRDHVHNFEIKEAKKTHWSDKYAHDKEKLKENKKMKIVSEMLKSISGSSVLDIGTNKGYYLDILKDRFDRLIGFDCDERCIDLAEEYYGDDNTTFVKFGIEDCFVKTNSRKKYERYDRYKSDLVLALAVTHHFATNNIDASKAAESIAKMANKHILIEDINNDNIYANTFKSSGFKLIDVRDSDPSGRKLQLWSK